MVQYTNLPNLAKVGENTAASGRPADRTCCTQRQYALRLHACSAWGWTFIITLSILSTLYVGGGIGFGVKTLGAEPGIEAHPHSALWRQAAGLAQDGAVFAKARLDEMRGQPPAAASGLAEPLAPDADARRDAGGESGETGAAAEAPAPAPAPAPGGPEAESDSDEDDDDVVE